MKEPERLVSTFVVRKQKLKMLLFLKAQQLVLAMELKQITPEQHLLILCVVFMFMVAEQDFTFAM